MKKFIIFILTVIFLVLAIFAVKQTEKVNRISTLTAHSVSGNVAQLCNFYNDMYAGEAPSAYFESSLLYMDKICDSLKEEISFYHTLYPKKKLFLENIADDYKLVLKMLNEREITKELVSLHGNIHSYIEEYNKVLKNSSDGFYEKDKAIKENDDKYEDLHLQITDKLHNNK